MRAHSLQRYFIYTVVALAVLTALSPLGAYFFHLGAAQIEGGSKFPERILLTWADEASSTQTVTWQSTAQARPSYAEIAEEQDGPKLKNQARKFEAQSRPLSTDAGQVLVHRVDFKGLKPATLYAYRVCSGGNCSEWNQFRTAAASPEPFSFLYFGDVQREIDSLFPRLLRRAFATAPDARFLVFAGDIIDKSYRDHQWRQWFQAGDWIFRQLPVLPAIGNHEQQKAGAGKALTPNWTAQFALPTNGPESQRGLVFWLDYQGVRFVVLNSSVERSSQAAWLDRVLESNPNRWTIAVFHHPLYSASRGRSNEELRRLWEPSLVKHKVDLVLQGHDHVYARGQGEHASEGPVYVVSVSGGKMYPPQRRDWAVQYSAGTQMFHVVRIEGDRLRFESRTPRGTVLDAFTLEKTPEGGSRIADSPGGRR